MAAPVVLLGADPAVAPSRPVRWARYARRNRVSLALAVAMVAAGLATRDYLTALGALLVGQTTGSAGANKGFANEKAEAWKFTAAKTGTVEEIEILTATGASTATTVKVAVMTDAAGVPGTIIGSEVSKVETPAENAAYKVTGLSAAVTSGTVYWLVMLPIGGLVKIKEGTTAGYSKSTGAVSEISKAAWTASENKGPVGIAGIGTESGGGVAVPLAAASSSSAATLALMAATQVPLDPAASLSAAQLAVTVATQVPLAAGASLSAGQLAVTVPTAVPLAPAASLSAGSLAVTVPGAAAVIPLAPASSTSSGAATVNTPGALLVGEEASQVNGVAASLARLVAGQFTALSTGIVHELWVWMEKTAAAKVKLGLMSESAGLPGAVLGKGLVTGQAPEPGWVKLVGLSIAVTAGTKYWLVATRTNGAFVVAAHGPAGTPVVQSVGEPGEIEPTSWQEPQEQGPLRFAALGVAAPLVELAPGSSSSGGSAALNAATQVVLGAGGSLSAAQMAMLARTQVVLQPAGSSSTGQLAVSVKAPVALAPALGESSAGVLEIHFPALGIAAVVEGRGSSVPPAAGAAGSSPTPTSGTVGSGGSVSGVYGSGGHS